MFVGQEVGYFARGSDAHSYYINYPIMVHVYLTSLLGTDLLLFSFHPTIRSNPWAISVDLQEYYEIFLDARWAFTTNKECSLTIYILHYKAYARTHSLTYKMLYLFPILYSHKNYKQISISIFKKSLNTNYNCSMVFKMVAVRNEQSPFSSIVLYLYFGF